MSSSRGPRPSIYDILASPDKVFKNRFFKTTRVTSEPPTHLPSPSRSPPLRQSLPRTQVRPETPVATIGSAIGSVTIIDQNESYHVDYGQVYNHKQDGDQEHQDEESHEVEGHHVTGDAIIVDGEERWVIAKLMDKMYTDRRLYYKVRWDGYGPEADSWEPAAILKKQAPDVVKGFEEPRVETASKKYRIKELVSKSSDGSAIWVRWAGCRKLTLEPRIILMEGVPDMVQAFQWKRRKTTGPVGDKVVSV